MKDNELRGKWDRAVGFARELWGEVSGEERLFRDGFRQRLIGRLEDNYDLERGEAVHRLDEAGNKEGREQGPSGQA